MNSQDPSHWHNDVFSRPEHQKTSAEVWSASSSDWALLTVTVFALMALDFFAFRRIQSSAAPGHGHDASIAEDVQQKLAEDRKFDFAAGSSHSATICESPEPEPESVERTPFGRASTDLLVLGCWILCGLAFGAVIFLRRGSEAGTQWLCGYVLEWLLSFDNIFIFHLIFQTYKTPRELLHKALFLGILGAVVFRIVFFAALVQVLHVVHWVRFVFGVLLVYSGVQAAREEDEDASPADSMPMRFLNYLFGNRILSRYDLQGKRLLVTEGQTVYATLLVPVIFCLEVTDILFAVDSVSAKVAQIPDVYIAYTSSVLAMFGLRAMFFVVQDLVDTFELLKYGLCVILVFIGMELLVSDFVRLPIQVVFVVICSVFVVCIAGSATKKLLTPVRSARGAAGDGLSAAG